MYGCKHAAAVVTVMQSHDWFACTIQALAFMRQNTRFRSEHQLRARAERVIAVSTHWRTSTPRGEHVLTDCGRARRVRRAMQPSGPELCFRWRRQVQLLCVVELEQGWERGCPREKRTDKPRCLRSRRSSGCWFSLRAARQAEAIGRRRGQRRSVEGWGPRPGSRRFVSPGFAGCWVTGPIELASDGPSCARGWSNGQRVSGWRGPIH